MLLKGDVTTIVQKWGSMPRQAASKLDLASARQFLPELFMPRLVQTRIRHGFCFLRRG